MNMSKTSFCNFFKRATGKTFTFALNEMRINRAAMLLSSDKNRSIAEIAYSVGYNSTRSITSIAILVNARYLSAAEVHGWSLRSLEHLCIHPLVDV